MYVYEMVVVVCMVCVCVRGCLCVDARVCVRGCGAVVLQCDVREDPPARIYHTLLDRARILLHRARPFADDDAHQADRAKNILLCYPSCLFFSGISLLGPWSVLVGAQRAATRARECSSF